MGEILNGTQLGTVETSDKLVVKQFAVDGTLKIAGGIDMEQRDVGNQNSELFVTFLNSGNAVPANRYLLTVEIRNKKTPVVTLANVAVQVNVIRGGLVKVPVPAIADRDEDLEVYISLATVTGAQVRITVETL